MNFAAEIEEVFLETMATRRISTGRNVTYSYCSASISRLLYMQFNGNVEVREILLISLRCSLSFKYIASASSRDLYKADMISNKE